MSRYGAVMCIIAAAALGFALMIILDQKFGTKEKLREKLPILKRKPWLLIVMLPVFEVIFGLICIVMRVPEVVFYLTGGCLLGATVGTVELGE